MFEDVKVRIEQASYLDLTEQSLPFLFCGYAENELPYTLCGSFEEAETLLPAGSRMLKWAGVLFLQDNAPKQIALASSLAGSIEGITAHLEEEWRQLLLCSEAVEEDGIADIAQFLQNRENKVFFAAVESLEQAEALPASERLCVVLDPEMEGVAAAIVGASAGLELGSFSYKNLVLSGVSAQFPSTDELHRAHEANCVILLEKAGDVVTSEGKVSSGEYLDIVDARDLLLNKILLRTQKLLNQEKKIPYDNRGIAQLEAVCLDVLAEAFADGLIAVNDDGQPDYSVYYAPRSQTSAEDRAQRRYVEGRFSFTLAGAVHTAEIYGTLLI